MTQESHSSYMQRKLEEAREIRNAYREARFSATEAKRIAAEAAREAKRAAAESVRIEQQKRLDSLTPEARAMEELDRKIRRQGIQAASGNLLMWTNGNSGPALTSRYNQAIRITPKKLSQAEIDEAIKVVRELIFAFKKSPKYLLKLKVVRLELMQQSSRIKMQNKDLQRQTRKSLGKARSDISCEVDKELAVGLMAAIQSARNATGGYVYLKQWTLNDGTRWLKLGITNNPSRRDTEQNVLPVPAVTLRLMETQSMDQAAAIERALHQQLAAQKVTGAGNRELFHLDDGQLAALMAAMDS